MEKDIDILDELNKGCSMGCEAIDMIMKKVDNIEFNELFYIEQNQIKIYMKLVL